LKALEAPLAALKILVDHHIGETPRKTMANIARVSNGGDVNEIQNRQLEYSRPRHQTFKEILSEHSDVQPLQDAQFLATVKEIEDICHSKKIYDTYSVFDQLDKWYSDRNSDEDQFAILRREIRLGVIASGAQQIFKNLSAEDTETKDKLVGVLKFIKDEVRESSQVNNSLVGKFKKSSSYDNNNVFRRGHHADMQLPGLLGDRNLADLDQHHVNLFLKSAQDWRADLNKEQSANNSPLKEPSAKNKITSFLSHKFFWGGK
jgi:hypothetical protein